VSKQQVRASVQRILDAMSTAPAYVRNGRGDILAANQLGYALYSEMYTNPARPVNTAHFVFLDPRAPSFFIDWERVANDVVAALRSKASRDPYDRALSNLVGALSTQSEEFRTLWAAHSVRFHNTGVKRIHHPIVGDLTLTYETMQLTADTSLTLAAYIHPRVDRGGETGHCESQGARSRAAPQPGAASDESRSSGSDRRRGELCQRRSSRCETARQTVRSNGARMAAIHYRARLAAWRLE
jgi:hypothetical protein